MFILKYNIITFMAQRRCDQWLPTNVVTVFLKRLYLLEDIEMYNKKYNLWKKRKKG